MLGECRNPLDSFFFSKKTKITLLQGLSSSAFYMLYIFVVSTAWVKYKNKSWKVSLGYLLFQHITTGVIFQMPTLFCFSLGDKKRTEVKIFCKVFAVKPYKVSQKLSKRPNCFWRNLPWNWEIFINFVSSSEYMNFVTCKQLL